ncbi:MAG: caspase family protein, partial [Dehalococcoidales bacterium]
MSKISVPIFLGLVTLIVTVFVLPCLPAQAADGPQSWAVIAGVSDYAYINNTWYGADDAQNIYNELSPVWGESHIRLLTNSQATKHNILAAIKWLADNAKADDTVLFSFSGHGDSGGYFCPYDTSIYNTFSMVSSPELSNSFSPMESSKVIVIMDTCFAGEFQPILTKHGRVLLLGTSPNEYGWETTLLGSSVFNYFIMQAFANFDTVDTNHDYELSAEEIFQYAAPLTSQYEINNEYDSIQHPTLDDQILGDAALLARFIFALNTALPYGTNILTLDGVSYTAAPGPLLWAPDSLHTITVPQIVETGRGTRYAFSTWGDGNTSNTRVVSKGYLTATYNIEQLLKLMSSYGDPAGAGWYRDGATATFSVTPYLETPDTRHYFTGWSGDYSGTDAAGSVLMSKPKTITANWRNEYLLTVDSVYGSTTGAGWYNEGSSAVFSVTPYIELKDTKHIFTGWSGDFSGTDSSASLVISSPKKVAANWRNEYLLTVNSEYGQPTGAGWYQ